MKDFPAETAAWIRANAWTDLERTLYSTGLHWVYDSCPCQTIGECLPCKRGDHAHCVSQPRAAEMLTLFGACLAHTFDVWEVGHPHRCPCYVEGHRGWVAPPRQGDLFEEEETFLTFANLDFD